MIRTLVESGANENETERHTIEINGCVMVAERWKHFEGEGFILFTSAKVNLTDTRLVYVQGKNHFVAVDTANPENTLSVISFAMKPPAKAILEKPERRRARRDRTRSPRQAQEPYYFEEHDDFFIMHEMIDDPQKPARFADTFERYQRDFCDVAG
ncbi:MAG: hypothetical protein AAGD13_16335 [Pseudomonadota bacterium]